MHRRGFLSSLVALVVAPFLPKPPVFISYKSAVDRLHVIETATYPFWRNQQALGVCGNDLNLAALEQAMRDVYDRCESSMDERR